jgi:hypothetical protein
LPQTPRANETFPNRFHATILERWAARSNLLCAEPSICHPILECLQAIVRLFAYIGGRLSFKAINPKFLLKYNE